MKSKKLSQVIMLSAAILAAQGCALTPSNPSSDENKDSSTINSNYCIAGAAAAWLLTGSPIVTTLAIGGAVWCVNEEHNPAVEENDKVKNHS